MTEAYGWISGIQSMLKTSSSLLDYPPKERMCRMDSKVLVSTGKREASSACMRNSTQRWGGCTTVIEPILPEIVWTGCYIIASKVMRSYYKGKCTLDALSIADFCANGDVFNWCSYLLEELLVA
jgi:hypothetical protein